MENYVGLLTDKGIVATKKDYNWFELDGANRLIQDEHVDILLNDFNNGIDEVEYPFMSPIVVYFDRKRDKGIIQQGHHRFIACTKTNRNINYVLTNVKSVTKGQNNGHQDFTIEELVYSYKLQGNQSYKELYKIYEQYEGFFSYASIEVAMFGYRKTRREISLKSGNFAYSQQDLETCKKVLERYIEFNNVIKFGRSANREIVHALHETLERRDFNWKYFIKRCPKFSNIKDVFTDVSSYKNAKAMIERIYNFSSREIPFYFNI